MANDCKATFRVERYASYWIVHKGNSFASCKTENDLIAILKGRISLSLPEEEKEKKSPRKETVEEFYARTGETVETIREKTKKAFEKQKAENAGITLADLGFKKPKEPGVPVCSKNKLDDFWY